MNKFTLIIPTRERADTLFWTLKTCVEQTYENFEIIVSDNFSKDNTEEVIRSFSDSRIKYTNPGKRVSMTANFEHGLSKVKEGYVCFLGDDDALLPGCLGEVSELFIETKTKALSWNPATYIWNSVSDKEIAGRLKIPLKNTFHFLDGKKVLKETETDIYRSLKMPSPYWSFVDVGLISQCYRDGRFFHSFIPDTYAGAMLSGVCGEYVFSNKPYSVSGSSHHSNALGFFNKKINQESNRVFLQENDLHIHPKIEIGPSSALLLTEPLLQAYERLTGFKIDIYRALDAALWEAKHCGDEELFNLITESVKQSAIKNGCDKKIDDVISKNRFLGPRAKDHSRASFSNDELFILTQGIIQQGFKIETIYEASRFVTGMLATDRPRLEPEVKEIRENRIVKKISELLYK